jgi:hypothetical protein
MLTDMRFDVRLDVGFNIGLSKLADRAERRT